MLSTGELRSSALACPCAFIESLSTLVRLLLVSDDDETMPMNGEQSDRRCWFCPFFMSTTDGDMTASCWSCPWCIVIIINLSWFLQSEYSSIYSYSAGWDCSWQVYGPVGDSIDVALVAIISTMIGDAMFIHSFASKKSLAMGMHLGLLAFLRPLSQSGSWAHRMCSAISHSLTFFCIFAHVLAAWIFQVTKSNIADKNLSSIHSFC